MGANLISDKLRNQQQYNTKLSESDIEELKNIINNNTCD